MGSTVPGTGKGKGKKRGNSPLCFLNIQQSSKQPSVPVLHSGEGLDRGHTAGQPWGSAGSRGWQGPGHLRAPTSLLLRGANPVSWQWGRSSWARVGGQAVDPQRSQHHTLPPGISKSPSSLGAHRVSMTHPVPKGSLLPAWGMWVTPDALCLSPQSTPAKNGHPSELKPLHLSVIGNIGNTSQGPRIPPLDIHSLGKAKEFSKASVHSQDGGPINPWVS